MTYGQAIEFLYGQRPAYERQGDSGYKPGLGTSLALDDACGNPTRRYPTIHIAGTNGKGSTASMIAATLTAAGLRTGLYTSPHYIDFRERIRVDGEMITRRGVSGFVERASRMRLPAEPSFFELTTAMAFDWFARRQVDVAVIEVGLGGRLDSTNIITPVVSVITSIALDHTSLLGDTIEDIATEKGGIIKPGVPVVVGPGVPPAALAVLERIAAERHAPLTVADASLSNEWCAKRPSRFVCDLPGDYQRLNLATALAALNVLTRMGRINSAPTCRAFQPLLADSQLLYGLSHVAALTGLRGRWQHIALAPSLTLVIDAAHNPAAFTIAMRQLLDEAADGPLCIVLGMMADKDVDTMLRLLPASRPDTTFIFTNADTPRAMPAVELQHHAAALGIDGNAVSTVAGALNAARRLCPAGLIYAGGSMYVEAEVLKILPPSEGGGS